MNHKNPVRSRIPLDRLPLRLRSRRWLIPRSTAARLGATLVALAGGAVGFASPANAQVAGTAGKPLPNILLLVDTSGSMERMSDGSLPSASVANKCAPGTATPPNRWGMLVQALTGNLQPFYSCEELTRAAGSPFAKEYSIAGKAPYDVDYFLPYHRPMTGDTAANACVVAPHMLPGTSAGVGPGQLGSGGNATDFPDTALATVTRTYLNSRLSSNNSLEANIASTNQCVFNQAVDGQLDAARDYARFALMTFDNDTNEKLGYTGSLSGVNGVDTSGPTTGLQPPFLGQWSYLRSPLNPYYSSLSNVAGVGAQGRPTTTPPCAFSFQEVGARNEAAPPWEGRLIKFPDPYASLYDLQRRNDELQKVLLASRPFGATPIDGMMDDARDYYWSNVGGPKDDPFQCRDKYIILLTDGAPNLDLRPSCTGGTSPSTGAGDQCPFPETAGGIASSMKLASAEKAVTTYVIGFSVNGTNPATDGFPTALTNRNCKSWYEDSGGGNGSPTTMQTTCNALYGSSSIPAGSTADACCKLNEIALKGSQDGVNPPVGAFFAESQADIVLSFGRIMANIIKAASTRTVPAYSPTAQFSASSFSQTATTAGQFIASFIPNSQRPWSGEIDRTRYSCNGGLTSVARPQSAAQGDLMSVNLAQQTKDKKRVFLSVVGSKLPSEIDSLATLRPFANPGIDSSTGPDAIGRPDSTPGAYQGAERVMLNYDLHFAGNDWPLAMNVDNRTCKRSRTIATGATFLAGRGSKVVPALDDVTNGPRDCSDVIWGFTTAYPDALNFSGTPSSAGTYNFNIRCDGGSGGSASAGSCSVSGAACTVGTTSCPEKGEVCVPQCSALGAIFRSNPLVIGPPNDFLREEGFRSFQAGRRNRKPVTFVATTDGLLHAFNSLDEGGPAATPYEIWAFAPPAVLPRLASNYPAGNQVILDGSPIVREVIWDRVPADATGTNASKRWHTTLVAGLGAGGGGYYAMNVTDADCGGTGNCGSGGSAYEQPATVGNLDEVSTNGNPADSSTKRGPHFLWQLTDIARDGVADPARVVRKSTVKTSGSPTDMVALFGKNTGTPTIGMLQVRKSGEEHQIGVAILPGGFEDPPVKGGTCARGGAPQINDTTTAGVGATRTAVRQWASSCTAPVPGRGITIVRLDNGEIIRHFGRVNQDVPKRLVSKTTNVMFDSPIVGTPVAYPNSTGVPIQKVFVGDADGTVWRLDLTSTDPAEWRAALFQDLYAGQAADAGQPIQVPPVVSTDEAGNVVLNVATGDQESIVVNASETNYVYSIREVRDTSTNAPRAEVRWFKPLLAAERVTGPMVVFDRTLFFATYRPQPPTSGSSCGDPGAAKLWGLNYFDRAGTVNSGGLPRWCPLANVDLTDGTCTSAFVDQEAQGPDLIPGVTLRTSSSCSTLDLAPTDELGGAAFSQVTPVQYSLSYGISRPSSSGPSTAPQADRRSTPRPLPRTSTRVDSWSIVIE